MLVVPARPARLVTVLVLAVFAGCAPKPDPVTSAPPGTHVPAPPPVATGPGAALYTARQSVHIDWEGTWYAGHVVAVGSGGAAGQYRTHYDGRAPRASVTLYGGR